ncbi:MAG TPA: ABC transporter substrate-binding protein [Tepidisphaeraceae bacterium]|jgi:arabinosaccharide transport system substrate-binding protein|nr:ABC transporter substrate-binding protein [Tepidisphaeraceae bacterium]
MGFPYGTAPLVILLIAIVSGAAAMLSEATSPRADGRPDLIFATFSKEHAAAYQPAVERFELEHGVDVQLQVVSQRALQGRLQSSMQVGADVPDMVELLDGTLGVFAKGPVEDVGFVDLTEHVHREGLYDRLVTSRFGKWSSRGHIFALPHDVHSVMLAYRRDLVEDLGIDVSMLTTWDEFCRVGREVVTKDLTGDGVPDRYMIDLPADGGDALRLLMLQRGGAMFDEAGNVAFDNPAAVDVIDWYVRRVAGEDRISFPAGWGQNLAKAMTDGLVLFYICPDWRLKQFESDVPSLAGKMALMPVPAWEPGARRTTTWGGTGLAITKQCGNPDLAWKLAMHLYYDPAQLGERFAQTLILPPLKQAWTEPQIDAPSPVFSGMRVGRAYADLATQVPEEQSSAYMTLAVAKLSEAYNNALAHFQAGGEANLHEVARNELKSAAGRVRTVMERNRFLRDGAEIPVAAAAGTAKGVR